MIRLNCVSIVGTCGNIYLWLGLVSSQKGATAHPCFFRWGNEKKRFVKNVSFKRIRKAKWRCLCLLKSSLTTSMCVFTCFGQRLRMRWNFQPPPPHPPVKFFGHKISNPLVNVWCIFLMLECCCLNFAFQFGSLILIFKFFLFFWHKIPCCSFVVSEEHLLIKWMKALIFLQFVYLSICTDSKSIVWDSSFSIDW